MIMKNELSLIINNGERQGEIIKLLPGEYIVGRDPSVDIIFKSQTVSRRHAKIIGDDSRFYIEDLNSQNGTKLNNNIVDKLVEITDNSEITVGEIKMRVKSSIPGKPTQFSNRQKSVPHKRRKKIKIPGQQESSLFARIFIVLGIIGLIALGITQLIKKPSDSDAYNDKITEFNNLFVECYKNINPDSHGYKADSYSDAYNKAANYYKNERYYDSMNMLQTAVKKINESSLTDKAAKEKTITNFIQQTKMEIAGLIVGKKLDNNSIKPGYYWEAKLQEEKLHYEGALRSWILVKNAVPLDHPFVKKANEKIKILKICLNKNINVDKKLNINVWDNELKEEEKEKYLRKLEDIEKNK